MAKGKYDRVQKVVPYVRRNKHTGKLEAIRPHVRTTSYDYPMSEIKTRHANRTPFSIAKDESIRANIISPHQWMQTPGSGDIEGVDRLAPFKLQSLGVSTELTHLYKKIAKYNRRLPKALKFKPKQEDVLKYFNNKLKEFKGSEKMMKQFMDRLFKELYKRTKPKLDALRKK